MCRDFSHTLEALGRQHETDFREEWLRGYYRELFVHETELFDVDIPAVGRVVAKEMECDQAF